MEATTLALIALCYDAALAPEKWRAFMTQTTRALEARSAGLRDVDYDAERVRMFETVGFDPAYVAAYREHFVHVDTLAPACLAMPVGAVVTGDEVVPWEHQRKTEFGNDYLVAQNIRHLMGCILERDANHHLLLGIQREHGQPDFDADDRRLFGLIVPHVARAAHIHRVMAEVTVQKQWALSALDRLRVGVILLDAQARPLHLNREAERLVAAGSIFVARGEGLALSTSGDTSRLKRLVADAVGLATGRGIAGGGCMRAAGKGGSALQLQVIPLPHGLSESPLEQSLPAGCVAVFISIPGNSRLPWERLAAMHGLTRAEAKLASLVADGVDPEQAAETLLVSLGTVRSQLKSIFAKTGVTRQAELVALLLADMLTDPSTAPTGLAA